MTYRRTLATSFGLKVALPAALAVAVIAYLLYTVISGLLADIGNNNSQFARAAAHAFQSYAQDRVAGVVLDNAKWDEAAAQTVGRGNRDWINETWGQMSTGETYDTVAVLDAGGRMISAFQHGAETSEPLATLTGTDHRDILDLIKRLEAGGKVANAISVNGKTYRVLAMARITNTDGAARSSESRYLLMANELGHSFLKDKGSLFGLAGLEISASPATDRPTVAITSPLGEKIGFWSWNPDNRTAAARARYSQIVWAILGSLIFVISVLVNMSWKGFREAHVIKAEAIASALRDDLTGLPNRRKVIQTLNEHLARPYEADGGLSLIFADLDGFKEVNDAYGHEIGDQLLKSAAAGFEFLAAGRAMVSRLGGDEFCLVISGPTASTDAREIAKNMRLFLAEPIVFGGRVASVSVSAGIVDRSPGDVKLDAEEFLRRADTAMYSAKSGGRNAVHIYDPSLDSKREENRRIARDLRAHIDANAMRVVYQPIVDSKTRQVAGVEALLRWPTGTATTVTPDVFIPVAEEFGMIEELGFFVLNEACRQAVQWPGIFMSVNVSPLQFMNPSFSDTVERILRSCGLEPQRLEIEVTEGLIIDNTDRVARILDRLHRLGISVALDDFGTGFSSIGQLRRFHFDKLKLDRSMVRDILRNPSALRLLQGTIAMADSLGLRVTAEGVEDENQVAVLRLAGCSHFQGYLFSRPVEPWAIAALLNSPALAQTA